MKYTTDFFRVDTNPPDQMRRVLFIDKHSNVMTGWITGDGDACVPTRGGAKIGDLIYWFPMPSYYGLKHIENICK